MQPQPVQPVREQAARATLRVCLHAGDWDALAPEGGEELALGAGPHASSFELVARIRSALERIRPAVVIVPDVEGSAEDERAVACACAAAVASSPELRVRVACGAPARVVAELDGPAAYERARAALGVVSRDHPLAATAVISTWNKCADVCANLDAIRAQVQFMFPK